MEKNMARLKSVDGEPYLKGRDKVSGKETSIKPKEERYQTDEYPAVRKALQVKNDVTFIVFEFPLKLTQKSKLNCLLPFTYDICSRRNISFIPIYLLCEYLNQPMFFYIVSFHQQLKTPCAS